MFSLKPKTIQFWMCQRQNVVVFGCNHALRQENQLYISIKGSFIDLFQQNNWKTEEGNIYYKKMLLIQYTEYCRAGYTSLWYFLIHCTAIWSSAANKKLYKLQLVQKRAAHLVFNEKKYRPNAHWPCLAESGRQSNSRFLISFRNICFKATLLSVLKNIFLRNKTG